MSHYELDITFKTAATLSQHAGMELWAIGYHFNSVPGHGGRTYRLKSRGTAKTAKLAQDGLEEAIAKICEIDNAPLVQVVGIKVKGDEGGTDYHTQTWSRPQPPDGQDRREVETMVVTSDGWLLSDFDGVALRRAAGQRYGHAMVLDVAYEGADEDTRARLHELARRLQEDES